ncbi:hypothetical protein WA158_008136 [Blastocystis sp. Blastoise]
MSILVELQQKLNDFNHDIVEIESCLYNLLLNSREASKKMIVDIITTIQNEVHVKKDIIQKNEKMLESFSSEIHGISLEFLDSLSLIEKQNTDIVYRYNACLQYNFGKYINEMKTLQALPHLSTHSEM